MRTRFVRVPARLDLGGAGLMFLALGTALIACAAGAAQSSAAAGGSGADAAYIVQLSDLPVAGYKGNVPGFAATHPAPGAKLDLANADVKRYRGYLKRRQDEVAGRVPGVARFYDYTLTFNGFAARMPASSAAKLARTRGVESVTKDELRTVDTVTTAAFLGLPATGGLWSQLGGAPRAGTGVVVGMVDSGITPEHPSFAPLSAPGRLHEWNGTCVTGEQWTVANCNNKIVGARFYNAGLGGDAAIQQKFPGEILSPRDFSGHGTHTSGTAAGDHNVDFVVNGGSFGHGSGMAPNARIAVYKVCWADSCASSDSVRAIEDATGDGVDVINFSISGSQTSNVDPVETAFLFAADAGVFVATSAGNSGPTTSTVAHNDPWVTTVAAGSHDRGAYRATATLGNGASYTGSGVGAAVPSSPLVLSANVALTGAAVTGARLCFSRTWDAAHPEGFLDSAQVAGKIVVCDRGTNDRVDKSRAVQEAGGVGMILVNTSPSSLNADFHFVPTVHVSDTDGAAIKAYVSGAVNPTASLAAIQPLTGVKAPQVAAFSSRGPALAAGGDLLKPDLMAPGVDVLAAIGNPPAHGGRNFDLLSGTSMASPHVAGIAALLLQAHPKWSPMEIKSALMTSAAQVDNTGAAITTDTGGAAGAFDYGSGQVTPNSATDPGIVYDSDFGDWIRFLCGSAQLVATGASCLTYGSADPSDLNTANIAIGDLVGSQTVTREVTNVGAKATYTVQVAAPPGVDVTVKPTTLKLGGNGTHAKYTVTFTRTSAAFNQYATGALTWSDGTHKVRSQLVVRPVPVVAPAVVSGTGPAGQTSLSVKPGFTGALSSSAAGLVPATVNQETLSNPTGGSFNTAAPAPSPHTAKFTVSVPAGSTLARFATFDADVPAGTDLDVFVYPAGTATLVGSSAGGSSDEQVDLAKPAAGSYDVYVDLYALAPGLTQQAIAASAWALGSNAAGNLTVSPASTPVTAGQTVQLTAAWSGLTAGTRYLGRVSYDNGATTLGSTLVRVDA